eukprot:scaffold2966_cov143-Skeletonema_menzelii.AAC.10
MAGDSEGRTLSTSVCCNFRRWRNSGAGRLGWRRRIVVNGLMWGTTADGRALAWLGLRLEAEAEASGWRLLELEAGGWRWIWDMEGGGWRLEAGGWLEDEPGEERG